MHLLTILLQTDALPTNIWTVGGALATFATVIVFLFYRYDEANKARIAEMRASFDAQITQLRRDLDEEKQARNDLQKDINGGQIAKNNTMLEKVSNYLEEVKRKP